MPLHEIDFYEGTLEEYLGASALDSGGLFALTDGFGLYRGAQAIAGPAPIDICCTASTESPNSGSVHPQDRGGTSGPDCDCDRCDNCDATIEGILNHYLTYRGTGSRPLRVWWDTATDTHIYYCIGSDDANMRFMRLYANNIKELERAIHDVKETLHCIEVTAEVLSISLEPSDGEYTYSLKNLKVTLPSNLLDDLSKLLTDVSDLQTRTAKLRRSLDVVDVTINDDGSWKIDLIATRLIGCSTDAWAGIYDRRTSAGQALVTDGVMLVGPVNIGLTADSLDPSTVSKFSISSDDTQKPNSELHHTVRDLYPNGVVPGCENLKVMLFTSMNNREFVAQTDVALVDFARDINDLNDTADALDARVSELETELGLKDNTPNSSRIDDIVDEITTVIKPDIASAKNDIQKLDSSVAVLSRQANLQLHVTSVTFNPDEPFWRIDLRVDGLHDGFKPDAWFGIYDRSVTQAILSEKRGNAGLSAWAYLKTSDKNGFGDHTSPRGSIQFHIDSKNPTGLSGSNINVAKYGAEGISGDHGLGCEDLKVVLFYSDGQFGIDGYIVAAEVDVSLADYAGGLSQVNQRISEHQDSLLLHKQTLDSHAESIRAHAEAIEEHTEAIVDLKNASNSTKVDLSAVKSSVSSLIDSTTLKLKVTSVDFDKDGIPWSIDLRVEGLNDKFWCDAWYGLYDRSVTQEQLYERGKYAGLDTWAYLKTSSKYTIGQGHEAPKGSIDFKLTYRMTGAIDSSYDYYSEYGTFPTVGSRNLKVILFYSDNLTFPNMPNRDPYLIAAEVDVSLEGPIVSWDILE